MPRPLPSNQLHRVLDQVLEHGEPVAHATGAAREVDDEGAATHAGETARERGTREAGIDRHPKRLGQAGRFLVEHGPGGLRRHVAGGETGAAGSEHQIGQVPVGPGGEDARDARGIIGHDGPFGQVIAARLRPGGDRVP
jgi:hypothetical protein